MEKVIKLITEFLTRYKADEVEGVLLYGSALSGKLNKKSDIDILIALNTKENNEFVGCSTINGVKIEYFAHHIDNFYDLALRQIELNDPSRLTKFITSKIIYDKTGRFSEEVNKIRNLYLLPIRENHSNFTKKSIFHIKNRLDDLYSIINEDSFYAVYFYILNSIRELNTKINGYLIIPLAKTEKLFKDKVYMQEYIKSDIHRMPNKEFKERYLKCLKIKEQKEMIEDLESLFNYSFQNENFDSNNFELEFEKGDIGI